MSRKPERMDRLGIFDFVIGIGGCGNRVLSSLILAAENPYVINFEKKPISTINRFILLNTGLRDFEGKKVPKAIDILYRNEGATENRGTWIKRTLSITDDVSDVIGSDGAGQSYLVGEEAATNFVREMPRDEWKRTYERYRDISEYSGFPHEPPSILKYKLDKVGYDPQNAAVLTISGFGNGTGSGTTWLIAEAIKRFRKNPVVFNIVVLPDVGEGSGSTSETDEGRDCLNSLIGLANLRQGHLRRGHGEELDMFEIPINRGTNKQVIFIISNKALKRMRIQLKGLRLKEDRYSAFNEIITHWFIRPLITTGFDTNDLITHANTYGRGATLNVPIAIPAAYIPRDPDTNPMVWVVNACHSFTFADMNQAKGAIIQFYAHDENTRKRVIQHQGEAEDYIKSHMGISQIERRKTDREYCVLTNFSGVMILFLGPKLDEISVFKKKADFFAKERDEGASDDVSLYRDSRMEKRISDSLEDIALYPGN